MSHDTETPDRIDADPAPQNFNGENSNGEGPDGRPAPPRPDPQGPTLRIDKWLWFARFCKSRTIAADLAKSGKMRVSGTKVHKANHGVRTGDVLTFPLGRHIRVIRIVALGERRGPAPEARALFEDLDPPEAKAAPDTGPRPLGADREKGAGRPTKKERRDLDKLFER
jgi:ribosome-associated heat shock protein Hsp15